jgi:aminoglycoside phosphotransferase (APT) family kinase protein
MESSEILLQYLRAKLGRDAGFALPPVQLSGGFDTEIFAFALVGAPPEWSGDLILRLMPQADAIGGLRVRREAATHAALAGAGIAVPRILAVEPDSAPIGQPFLVMSRLAGAHMLAGLTLGRIGGRTRTLADTQAAFNRVPGAALLAEAKRAGLDPEDFAIEGWIGRLQQRIGDARLEVLRAAHDWIARHRPVPAEPEGICHGDYHPLNVMLLDEKLSGVIDWAMAISAEPAFDVAATRVVLSLGHAGEPDWAHPLAAWLQRRLIARYTRLYREAQPFDDRNLTYYEAMRVLSALIVAGEKAGDPRNPWGAPPILAGLIGHFERITGVRVRM